MPDRLEQLEREVSQMRAAFERSAYFEGELMRLRLEMVRLMGTVATVDGPNQRIMMVDPGAAGTNVLSTFTEQTMSGSNIVNRTDGRHCTGSGNGNVLISPTGTTTFAMQIREGTNMRNVKISGGDSRSVFPAFLTGISNTSTASYTFVEAQEKEDGTYQNLSSGRAAVAFEPNSFKGLEVSGSNVVHICETVGTSRAKVYGIVREVLARTNTANVMDAPWNYKGTVGASLPLVMSVAISGSTCTVITCTQTVDANGNTVAFSATSGATLFTTTNCAEA